mmetsp:Transcript_91199/g.162415  ORF Transcript_91199/g.162415 Transcript_91199/m.162415 type:complete len:165 (-) Transcript_91199:93-587(-)
MSDLKWGFKQDYGHRTLPYKWQTSSGFNYYEREPLNKKSHRTSEIPQFREDFLPITTNYGERKQDERWAMSLYGCHRDLTWDNSLRMPRNPFPGRKLREMEYIKQPSPASTTTFQSTSKTLHSTGHSINSRGSATPRGYRPRSVMQEYGSKDDHSVRSSFAKWE